VARGDWGESYRYRRPVRALIAERLPISFWLGGIALALAYALGVPLGAWLASCADGRLWQTARGTLFTLHALPSFVLGFCLWRLWGDARWAPILTYAAPALAGVALVARQTFVDERSQAYVAALRARGLSGGRIFRHLLPRALQPLLASFPTAAGFYLAGSVIVESLFAVPGLGRLSFEASQARDYPLLLGIVMVTATAQLTAQLAADGVLAWLDPRLRLGTAR
jgi:peptide/nickel transport system permease protein